MVSVTGGNQQTDLTTYNHTTTKTIYEYCCQHCRFCAANPDRMIVVLCCGTLSGLVPTLISIPCAQAHYPFLGATFYWVYPNECLCLLRSDT